MLLFFFLVLESLIFDVHAIFYANTTSENTAVSTFDPSAATSARPASVPITTVTPSSTSNAANITTSAFAQSSNLSTNSSILNVNTTSLPYLTIFVDANAFGTSTITECPGIYSIYHEYMQDPRNSTCCNYYNASGNVAAFDSWMTAGDDATSPYVGAKFGCCGDCVVRANNIQVYFWPGAQAMMECTTEITVSGIDTTVTPPTSYFISYFSSSWVDPAFGCNGSAPTPITTVINDNTLTSPTPWIGFTSIAAYDHCSQWWEATSYMTPITEPLSTYVSSITTTYPDDFSSGVFITTVVNVYSAINYTDYDECVNSPEHCNPIIEPRGGLYGVAKGHGLACDGPIVGYHDPPIALGSAQNLGGGPPQDTSTQYNSPPPSQQSHGSNQTPPPDPPPDPPQDPQNTPKSSDQAPSQVNQPSPANQSPPVIPQPTPTEPGGSPQINLPTLTIGPSSYTPNAQSAYNIDGQTLVPGGSAIIISGTTISLGSSATAIIIGGNTQFLQPSPVTDPIPPVTIGPNLILSPDPTVPGEYVIGAQTLIPGGPAAIVDGTAVALDQSGSFLIIDGTSTQNINGIASAITIGTETMTRNIAGQYVLDGKTLVPGAPAITVDGTVISLDPAGTAVVVDGTNTILLNSFDNNGYPTVITLGSHLITANQAGQFIIDGQTLAPGGSAATVGGTVFTLPLSGTVPVPILTLPTSQIGDYIIQGLGVTETSQGNGTTTSSYQSSVSTTENSSPIDTGHANKSGNGNQSDTSTKKNQGNRVCDTISVLSWEALLFGVEFMALLWV